MVDPLLEGLQAPECLEDHLCSLHPGKRTSLVGFVEVWKETGGHLCRSKVLNQAFVLHADLPKHTTTFAILGAIVQNAGRTPELQVFDSRYIFLIQPMMQDTPLRIIETCTGLSALGKGAEAAGFKVHVRNELRGTYSDVLRNTTDQPVVEGDIGKLKTMMEMWHASEGTSTVTSGFSCQPFSQGGDRMQHSDHRALTLAHTLVFAWLSQAPIVVLECVVEATSSVWVKRKLQEYCQMSKSHYAEVCLQLEHVWPAKRKRWWAVLTHQRIGQVQLQAFPKMDPAPVISDVLPYFLSAPQELIEDLRLSTEEHESFERYSKSMNSNLIDPHAVLPTALHSWGAQVTSCPCGCRSRFSHDRLANRGVYGALVLAPAVAKDQSSFRHIAPQEAAILCGFPMEKGWKHSIRLLLTGVGQLASPIQASWIFGHIRKHLQNIRFDHHDEVSPQSAMARILDDLFALRDAWFPAERVAMQVFRDKLDQTLQQQPKPSSIAKHSDFHYAEDRHHTRCHSSVGSPKADSVEKVHEHEQRTTSPSPELPSEAGQTHAVSAWEQLFERDPKIEELWQATGAIPGFLLPGPKTSEVRFENSPDHKRARSDVKLPFEAAPSTATRSQTNAMQLGECSHEVCIEREKLITIINVVDRTRVEVRSAADQLVGDLITAEIVLHPEIAELGTFDGLGRELKFTDPLEDGMCVVLTSLQLIDIAEDPKIAMGQIQARVCTMPRTIGVFLQHAFVASDELAFYVRKVAQEYDAVFIDPVIVDDILSLPVISEQWMIAICHALQKTNQYGAHVNAAFSAIHAHGHWMPVYVSVGPQRTLRVALTLGGEALWPSMFNEESRAAHKIRARAMETSFPNDCGFQAAAWLAQEVTGTAFELVTPEVALVMRQEFVAAQDKQNSQARSCILGGTQDVAFALGTILREHGVFDERIQDRVATIMEQLGASTVQGAILSTRPWAAIKQLANQHKPRIQLILQDEFDKVRQERAVSGKPVGDKSLKIQKRPARYVPQIQINPQDIALPHGVFKQKDGELLAQLLLRDVSPQAAGVVIGTEVELEPYFLRPTISDRGLALLVVNPSEACVASQGSPIRVPVASCLPFDTRATHHLGHHHPKRTD